MANVGNLRPIKTLSKEEAQKKGKNGGIKSGIARRQQKTFKDLFIQFSKLEITNDKLKDKLKKAGFDDEEMTNKTALMYSMYLKALKGDTKAFEIVCNLMGEKPADKLEINDQSKTMSILESINKQLKNE
jgi:hypothetical protein|nr:MAG TPA: hypothetical protein [Caudoviricetes sp.]